MPCGVFSQCDGLTTSCHSARYAAIECSTQYAGLSSANGMRSYARRRRAASALNRIIAPLPTTRFDERGRLPPTAGGGSRRPMPPRNVKSQKPHTSGQRRNIAGVPAMSPSTPNTPRTARLAAELARAAHVHERGDHVALDPPRALADPRLPLGARLFPGRRLGDADGLAVGRRRGRRGRRPRSRCTGPSRRARAAPSTRKWFDVPPSGIGSCQRVEPGQHVVEPERVLEREHAREHVLARVEVVQPRLEAHDVFGRLERSA